MNQRIKYVSKSIPSLREALSQKFVKMSVRLSAPMELFLPNSVTLWPSNGPGLRIFSQMIDIGKFKSGTAYLEEGILNFEFIENPELDQIFVELPDTFQSDVVIEKLVLYFSDMLKNDEVDLIIDETEYETGIQFTSLSGDSLVILPNAMPYCIAVKCSFHNFDVFGCNYDVAAHRSEPF